MRMSSRKAATDIYPLLNFYSAWLPFILLRFSVQMFRSIPLVVLLAIVCCHAEVSLSRFFSSSFEMDMMRYILKRSQLVAK